MVKTQTNKEKELKEEGNKRKKARFFQQRGRVEEIEERNKSRQKQERNQSRQRRNCKSFFFQKVVDKRWKQKKKRKGRRKL